MDRYKERLQADVRLLRRNLRNHLISSEQIKTAQSALPDNTKNARWIGQDGSPCNKEEQQTLLKYHRDDKGLLMSKVEG